MMLLTVELLIFAFAFWLGLYLFSRNLRDARLRFAGLGLVAYALGLALDVLLPYAPESAQAQLRLWQRPFLFLPALCWLILLDILTTGTPSWRQRLQQQKRPYAVILAATIFFGLGIGLLLFPLDLLPRRWLLPSIGIDLLLLGITIAFLDAFHEGETLLPHMLRSLTYAEVTALIFGGQVALVMAFGTGVTFPLLLLLLTTLAAAIFIQTFSAPFQTLLDRLALAQFPQARTERAALRAVAEAAPRLENAPDLQLMDPDDFARLTRRALSQMGNLPQLAASPLTRLPLVDHYLSQNGRSPSAAPSSLERAQALKQILAESIARLKPPGDDEFGSTDAWRHYNALHFPYVVGIRPYSRRAGHTDLDPSAQLALDWFRTDVPQRTLYNWQNAAARLVARDLRERSARSLTQ